MSKVQQIRLLAVVPLVLLSTFCVAQRHGRGDSAQNYGRGPELIIDLQPLHKKLRFHVSDLRKIKRTTLTITDPKSNNISEYEGVALDDLIASEPISPKGMTEVSYGFFHKRSIRNADLEQSALVADKVNGRPLRPDELFLFVAKTHHAADVVVIRSVVSIREKAANVESGRPNP
jgi:hypothetical protein